KLDGLVLETGRPGDDLDQIPRIRLLVDPAVLALLLRRVPPEAEYDDPLLAERRSGPHQRRKNARSQKQCRDRWSLRRRHRGYNRRLNTPLRRFVSGNRLQPAQRPDVSRAPNSATCWDSSPCRP